MSTRFAGHQEHRHPNQKKITVSKPWQLTQLVHNRATKHWQLPQGMKKHTQNNMTAKLSENHEEWRRLDSWHPLFPRPLKGNLGRWPAYKYPGAYEYMGRRLWVWMNDWNQFCLKIKPSYPVKSSIKTCYIAVSPTTRQTETPQGHNSNVQAETGSAVNFRPPALELPDGIRTASKIPKTPS